MEGDHLILGIDANENLQCFDTSSFKVAMVKVSMHEVIQQHQQRPPPNTYVRGKHQIDGIFISQLLTPIHTGLLSLHTSPSDHSTAWLDLSWTEALWYSPMTIVRPLA